MMPKPTATKKEAKTRTPTSRGNSANGLENLFFTLLREEDFGDGAFDVISGKFTL
jgi:hypothetical protein